MIKREPLPAPVNGLSVVWSPVNQTYLLMYHSSVLRVISNRDEAIAEFERLKA